MGFSCPALFLMVGDDFDFASQFCHHTPEEGDRVMQVPHDIDKGAVIQAKTGEMLNLLHVRVLMDQLVVAAAQQVHELSLVAGVFLHHHDFRALLPLPHHNRNHGDGLLKIAAHHDGTVPGGLQDAVIGRAELSEIPGVENGPDVPVLFAQLPEQSPGPVSGTVVNKEDFIGIGRQLGAEKLGELFRHGHHIFLLVKAGNHDTDLAHIDLRAGTCPAETDLRRWFSLCGNITRPAAV